MTVTLTPEQEKFINEQLKSGHFRSANEVITESLGIFQAQEEFIETHTLELREQMTIAREQIRRGEVVDGREAIQKMRAELQRRGSGKG